MTIGRASYKAGDIVPICVILTRIHLVSLSLLAIGPFLFRLNKSTCMVYIVIHIRIVAYFSRDLTRSCLVKDISLTQDQQSIINTSHT